MHSKKDQQKKSQLIRSPQKKKDLSMEKGNNKRGNSRKK